MQVAFHAPEQESDQALVQRIYDQYKVKMYRVALHILRSHTLAEDAVHNAFLKIINHLQEIRNIACQEIEPYVVIIVKRTALDMLKREKRLTGLDTAWPPAAEPGPEADSAYHRLVELIRTMPDTYREALELKCVLEWSNKDIAKRLALTENTVAVRLMRGKAMLRKRLEREGYWHD